MPWFQTQAPLAGLRAMGRVCACWAQTALPTFFPTQAAFPPVPEVDEPWTVMDAEAGFPCGLADVACAWPVFGCAVTFVVPAEPWLCFAAAACVEGELV